MKRISQLILFLLISLLLFDSAISQEREKKLTLDGIYKSRLIRTKGFPSVRWLPDGSSYIRLEYNQETGGQDIVKYDVQSGNKSVLIFSKAFVPAGETKSLDIEDYQWSNDNSKLLIFTNTARVWRYNTRGDYWVLDISTGKLQKLGNGLPVSSLMFAKFSPSADRVAYVSKNNIYVECLSDSKITKLTEDGCDYIINGTFDWVYEEELDCRDGFRWSSDGKYISYWQSDTRGTGTFYMINNIDSIYSKVIPIPYPKVGTTNSSVKVGVVSAAGGESKWFDIPGDPRNNYIARMDFIPNSNDLLIQQLNRLQNTNTVWMGNADNVSVNKLFSDSDSAWVDIHDDIVWLKGNTFFTWVSEKDGWLALYIVSRDGKTITKAFNADFDVINVLTIDEKNGYVYYIAAPDNCTQRYLYRSKMNLKSKPERITPIKYDGTNGYDISPNSKWAIHRFDNRVTPSIVSMISLPDHKQVRIFEENKQAKEDYEGLKLNPKEFFRVDIGEITLDAWMIKPPSFDQTKKYPVIFYVYGEPAGSTVQDRFGGGDLWHQYLASQGYLIMSVDNRGANVPRGRAWRKSVYKQIGILASKDQAAAAQKISQMYSFVDTSRIGIWGWSGGGSMTLNMLFRYPGIYKTGVAVAFVADEKLYDNVYQERYMALPENNPDGYKQGSVITHAANLKGNLLLIHGTGDDNVHYQNCEMLVNELVKYNKMFSMMAYPMRSHGIYERENTTYHLYQTMAKYWLEHLPAGGR